MAISRIASYAGFVTYGFAPVGLFLETLGQSEKLSNLGKYVPNPPPQKSYPELVVIGRTFQQLATMSFLLKTGLDYGLRGDYVIPSITGLGAVMIFAGGPLKPMHKDWITDETWRRNFAMYVVHAVRIANAANICMFNFPAHFQAGSLDQQVVVAASAISTLGLSLFVGDAA